MEGDGWVLLASSTKDTDGIVALDQRGHPTSLHLKSGRTERRSLATIQKSQSSTQGLGSTGDLIVAAQADKPLLHVYQLGKAEPCLHVHSQEITCSIASDRLGSILVCGSRKGNICVWDLGTGDLLSSWQGHFKAVTNLSISSDNQILVSTGEDGLARAWLLSHALESLTMQPFRSWNAHTLSITGMRLVESTTSLRVWTCSLDRYLNLHDIHSNRTLLRIPLPQPLESLTVMDAQDRVLVGGQQGGLFSVDTLVATAETQHNSIAILQTSPLPQLLTSLTSSVTSLPKGVHAFPPLHGNAAVTQLVALPGQAVVVSACALGKLCWWDVSSRQCLREVQVFSSAAVANCLLVRKSEAGAYTAGQKASPLAPTSLKKYAAAAGTDPIATLRLPHQLAAEKVARELLQELRTWDWTKICGESRTAVEEMDSRDAIAENDDFLPMQEVAVMPGDAASSTGAAGEASALLAAQARIRELEEDTARWEAVCAKMKQHIEQLEAKRQPHRKEGGTEEEGEVKGKKGKSRHSLDTGDEAHVVAALQVADSTHKKRKLAVAQEKKKARK